MQCGGGFKHLGDDVSEQLEIIGAAFKVLRHLQRKRACACCDRIVQGAAPSRPIERDIAGPGLLAQIIVAKFAVREAACMAHARRKIHDLHTSKPTATTTEALRRIGLLYAIEEQLRGQPPDRRQAIRQEQARPLLDDFEAWLRTRLLTLSTQLDMTQAINYMLNQWKALIY